MYLYANLSLPKSPFPALQCRLNVTFAEFTITTQYFEELLRKEWGIPLSRWLADLLTC
jgi:hypothetical protein